MWEAAGLPPDQTCPEASDTPILPDFTFSAPAWGAHRYSHDLQVLAHQFLRPSGIRWPAQGCMRHWHGAVCRGRRGK
jgi:hypothetical protein